HIVRVYDEAADWERGLRLMWMQYVAGTSLREVIRALSAHRPGQWGGRDLLEAVAAASRGPVLLDLAALRPLQPMEESNFAETPAWLGARLAEALAHAHELGIVHRDVKPANILISSSGRPLLADFNLAIVRAGSAAESIGGTLAYMAPEHREAFAGTAP